MPQSAERDREQEKEQDKGPAPISKEKELERAKQDAERLGPEAGAKVHDIKTGQVLEMSELAEKRDKEVSGVREEFDERVDLEGLKDVMDSFSEGKTEKFDAKAAMGGVKKEGRSILMGIRELNKKPDVVRSKEKVSLAKRVEGWFLKKWMVADSQGAGVVAGKLGLFEKYGVTREDASGANARKIKTSRVGFKVLGMFDKRIKTGGELADPLLKLMQEKEEARARGERPDHERDAKDMLRVITPKDTKHDKAFLGKASGWLKQAGESSSDKRVKAALTGMGVAVDKNSDKISKNYRAWLEKRGEKRHAGAEPETASYEEEPGEDKAA